MQVAVIGCGYVGLATSVVLADLGHTVKGVEIDQSRLDTLQRGESHIFEAYLPDLLSRGLESGRLAFTSDHNQACSMAQVIFLAVGTPTSDTWQIDLSQLEGAIDSVASALNANGRDGNESSPLIIVKSTVPSGTMDYLKERLAAQVETQFRIGSNPEFLREGQAIFDTLYPDRIVVGAEDDESFALFDELYRGLIVQDFDDTEPRPSRPDGFPVPVPVVKTSPRSAEMIKYASNAFLATKISFINEIANLCEEVGADINDVANGIGLDTRIGPKFLQAGIGYGGSCFPKDTKALHHHAGSRGYTFTLLNAVIEVNRIQRYRFLAKVRRALNPLPGKKIAILGLAFKPGTDDIREAPALDLMSELKRDGAELRASDPQAIPSAREIFSGCEYFDDPLEALDGADAAIVVTEWPDYISLDWDRAADLMNGTIIFDGRNCLDKTQVEKSGLRVIGVGR